MESTIFSFPFIRVNVGTQPIMKRLISILALCALIGSCSLVTYVPLESGVLKAKDFGYLRASVEELDSVSSYGAGAGEFARIGSWRSHTDRHMDYSVSFDCDPKDAASLLEDYRNFLLATLESTGASIEKNSTFTDAELSESLEFSGRTLLQSSSGMNTAWGTGFTIAYSKSNVSGGISVGHRIEPSGRNFFEVAARESQ